MCTGRTLHRPETMGARTSKPQEERCCQTCLGRNRAQSSEPQGGSRADAMMARDETGCCDHESDGRDSTFLG